MTKLSKKTLRIAKEIIDKLPEYMTGPAILTQEEDEVWINIQTILPPEQACEEFNKFDDEYLIYKLTESNGKVNVSLEFI